MALPSPIAALSLDAGGALLHPAEPVGRTYARHAAAFGGRRGEREVGAAFSAALSAPRAGPRYVGDGRPFWRGVVARATGVDHPACFAAIYAHYENPAAWRIAPGACEALDRWRRRGGRAAIVSDWDTRLRPLLGELELTGRFDAVIVSAEVGIEKPDPRVFGEAAARMGVRAGVVLHLGDSLRRDVRGARQAGMRAMMWTGRAPTLAEIVADLLRGELPGAAG